MTGGGGNSFKTKQEYVQGPGAASAEVVRRPSRI